MKLCRLTFKNLNSLAGEWRVNFESPEYAAGLFAITGPTGAGKTTLLDALCLALFGRTPRLGLISKSGNEIMTRGARECAAEAVFAAGGAVYCAQWSQKKTTGKDGTERLQQPKHRFARLSPDEETLADKTTEVAKAVEQACRLDFERFTRAVMLPQGGFAAFLQANVSERARILEELTGAELYRGVSKKVYERANAEQEKLASLRQTMAERAVLSAEERSAAETCVAQSEANEARFMAEGETLREAQAWYARHDELQRRAAQLAVEQQENAAEQAGFAPQVERLNIAERAATLSDLHDALTAVRGKTAAAAAESDRAARSAEEKAAGAAAAAEAAEKASDEYEALRAEAEANAELWARVTALDLELKGAEKDLSERGVAAAEAEKLAAQSEEEQRRLAKALEAAQARLPKLEAAESAARAELERALDAERRADLTQLRASLREGQPCPLCGSVQHPAPFAAHEEEEASFHLHEAAEAARSAADAAENALRSVRDEIARAEAGLRAQNAACETAQAAASTAREKAASARAACEEKRRARAELFGEKDPAKENRQFQNKLSLAEKSVKTAREAETAAKVANAQAQTERDHTAAALAAVQSEGAEREAAFAGRLGKLGFRTEEEWQNAALDEETRAVLAAKKERLEGRARELAALLPAAQAELAAHAPMPPQPRAGLEELLAANAAALSEVLTARGADAEALRRDDENRARLAELGQQEARQQKTCAVWRDLNDLIGSAGGDKFSRYVQSLTFRRLVRAANVQLERLSDRYRLQSCGENALSLEVIDLWQGGQSRSSKNLSGGESFIVSLALALALSHGMKEVKVDSLFLDEGFGTLDEETLESVLDCLDHLRDMGKLVGVISHVKALQERLDCRIAVVPDGRGHSRLDGPGCERLS